jgi:hypothetical protein
MWLLAYSIVALSVGALLFLKPHEVRERLMPDWRRHQGPLAGTSTLSFRFAGLCIMTIGALTALGFFVGTR